MSDPMAMANAMMAFQRQAVAWIAATKEALVAAGHGFTPDDEAAIAASHAANPYPDGYSAEVTSRPEDVAAAQATARQAMAAVYPPNGFEADDPRIAAEEGITLALAAIGAKAIGWSTDDAYIGRIVAALGVDRAVWDRATTVLRERAAGDVVVGAFYGQLYTAA